ncbi:MAG: hypothetical protein IJC07_06635 [Clostridia bacterium]|nr:hypothetical protein [Clostridia bacterium]
MKKQQARRIIDIHSHALPFVDDGSVDVNASLAIIEEYRRQGVNSAILTPHYRGKFKLPVSEIKEEFKVFCDRVIKDCGEDIDLYLGQEIFAGADVNEVVEQGLALSLANSKYVLVEFDYALEEDISEKVYELSYRGYIPIVAHIERYVYADIDMAIAIKQAGGLIQVNANSVVGRDGKTFKKKVNQLLKLGLVDFVASDVHDGRVLSMEKAYKHIQKKFGEKVCEDVFYNNAKKIIEG